MQESTFDILERVRPATRYNKPISKRIKILENNIRELRKYHTKAGKNKRSTIQHMIDKYTACLERLNSLI